MPLTVAIGGLGTIGLAVARALDCTSGPAGVEGLRLVAVSARNLDKAAANLADFVDPPEIVELEDLAGRADIVLEAASGAVFERIAEPALRAGRVLVPCSVSALLPRLYLVALAQQTGGRIVVPTGALPGLDAVRACAEGPVESITLEARRPPAGLAGSPYLAKHNIDALSITTPTRVFEGNAVEAAAGFPSCANVAIALALAGIGAVRTRVAIWADPAVEHSTHTVRVRAEAARLSLTVENVPSEAHPRTGRLAPLAAIACLRGLVCTLKLGG